MLTIYLVLAILVCLAIPPFRFLSVILLLILGYTNIWACVALLIVVIWLFSVLSSTNGS